MSEKPLPLVLVTEGGDVAPMKWLREHARVEEVKPTDAKFDALLAEAEGLSVRTYTKVNEALLARAPKLKVVGRGGVGLENIDVVACRKRGVEVVYTPDANTLAVGDFVFGAIVQLIRPWARFKDRVYGPEEFKKIRSTLRGRQLNELTIGILGLGRVGKRVGHIAASGFGMRVLFHDLLAIDRASLDFEAEPVDEPTLMAEADILTIHVDMRPGNENLVSTDQIARMKHDAILINMSRGEVLDVHAVAAAIKAKKLGGAMLDVYAPEPPGEDFPLLGMENVILTPHMASRTDVATENMSWVVRDIVGVIKGDRAKYPAP
jgi:phosphoglycerate dehydrogenase-like enzyme